MLRRKVDGSSSAGSDALPDTPQRAYTHEQQQTCGNGSFILVASCFLCGFGNAVPEAALRVYIVSVLHVEPATQVALFDVPSTLPWQFKLFVAFLSDVAPICGRRRQPYLMLALAGKGLLMMGVAYALPGVRVLAGLVFLGVWCQLVIGVTLDTLVVEQMAREETGATFGRLQTHSWVALTLGSLAGQVLGMVVLGAPKGAGDEASRPLVQACFAMGAVAQLANLLLVTLLGERRVAPSSAASTRSRCCADSSHMVREVVGAMRRKAVWWPCLFLFVQACQIGNSAAYDSFLLGHQHNQLGPQPLGWRNDEFAAIRVVGAVSNCVGAVCYRAFLKNAPLRLMFALLILMAAMASASQLLLITGENRKLGIADFVFVMGDTVIAEVVRFLLSMPILTLQAAMCPAAATSTVFALVTSLQMAGCTLGDSLSALMTALFGVKRSDYTALSKLTAVGACSKLVALPFLFLVPNQAAYEGAAATSQPPEAEGGLPSVATLDHHANLVGKESIAGSAQLEHGDVDDEEESAMESTPLLTSDDSEVMGDAMQHAEAHEAGGPASEGAPKVREPLTGAIVLTALLVSGTTFSICQVIYRLTKLA